MTGCAATRTTFSQNETMPSPPFLIQPSPVTWFVPFAASVWPVFPAPSNLTPNVSESEAPLTPPCERYASYHRLGEVFFGLLRCPFVSDSGRDNAFAAKLRYELRYNIHMARRVCYSPGCNNALGLAQHLAAHKYVDSILSTSMHVLNGLAFLCLPLAGSVLRDNASPTAQQGTTREADAPRQSDAPWTIEQDYTLVKGMEVTIPAYPYSIPFAAGANV